MSVSLTLKIPVIYLSPALKHTRTYKELSNTVSTLIAKDREHLHLSMCVTLLGFLPTTGSSDGWMDRRVHFPYNDVTPAYLP